MVSGNCIEACFPKFTPTNALLFTTENIQLPNVKEFRPAMQHHYLSYHALPNNSFIRIVSSASNALMSSKIDAEDAGASNL